MVDDNLIYMERCFAPIMDSLYLPPAALGSLPPDTFLRRLGRRRPLRVHYLNTIPKQKNPPFWVDFFLLVDDNLIYMERCFAPIMDSLFCGKATAVATVHRTVAKSRLSSPLSEYHTKKKNHPDCYFQSFKKNGPLPSAILAAAAIHGLSPGLKKCSLDTFLRRLGRRRPLRVHYLNTIPKQKSPPFWVDFFLLVDDNGLEPLTLRTSSACSTS